MATAVVIPLYNHEHFIGEAIRSVLAQTRPADRIVIVDDGSRDRSVEVVKGFDDQRIQLLTQENSGAHVALNRGVSVAAEDCEFIAILNSDDIYEPRRVEKCVGFLETNPQSHLVCTRMKLIGEDSQPLDPQDPKARWVARLWEARSEHLAEWLGIANFAKTSSNFVARASYLAAHPFRPYRYVHDYFLALEAALENRLAVINEELLLYRTHPANTIKSGPAENVTREVLAMNLDFLRELAPVLAESAQTRADYARYFRVLCQNYSDFRAEVFLHAIAQSLQNQPRQFPADLLRSLSGGRFPELNAPKSGALKQESARAEYEALLRQIAGSRWLALGRIFGAGPATAPAAPGAEKRLNALRKSCANSRWFRLGQRLGFVYADV